MKDKQLTVVHFSPLEKYPPAMNLINILSDSGFKIHVFTQKPLSNKNLFDVENTEIFRIENVQKKSKIGRSIAYVHFVVSVLIDLIRKRPKHILYFESLSALPAVFYKRLYKNSSILAHYHEYTSPSEYKNGMLFNRISFFFEKRMYSKFQWISHTNRHRIKLFKENFRLPETIHIHEFANFPPSSWMKKYNQEYNKKKGKVKLVYVGSIGFETMYLREICEWVYSLEEIVELHFYSDQIDHESKAFFKNIERKNIHFHGSIEYNEIPEVLRDFHVGLILYKGSIDNYKYVVPNKYFEYLCCGLDVWFPDKIESMQDYISNGESPKSISLDFQKLGEYDIEDLLSHEGLNPYMFKNFAEKEFEKILPFLS